MCVFIGRGVQKCQLLEFFESLEDEANARIDVARARLELVGALVERLALLGDEAQRLVAPHLQVEAVADAHAHATRIAHQRVRVEVAAEVDAAAHAGRRLATAIATAVARCV